MAFIACDFRSENFCWRLKPSLGKVELLSATSKSPPLGMWLVSDSCCDASSFVGD